MILRLKILLHFCLTFVPSRYCSRCRLIHSTISNGLNFPALFCWLFVFLFLLCQQPVILFCVVKFSPPCSAAHSIIIRFVFSSRIVDDRSIPFNLTHCQLRDLFFYCIFPTNMRLFLYIPLSFDNPLSRFLFFHNQRPPGLN